MWLITIPMVVVIALASILAIHARGGEDEIAARIQAQVALYRLFVSTADTRFKATPPPSQTTVYGWDELKIGAPTAIAASSMNPTWKAVRRSDGLWVACTEIDESAVAEVGGLFPDVALGMQGTRVVDLGPAKAAVSVGSEALSAVAADLCKGA